jgi:hypothetical protein
MGAARRNGRGWRAVRFGGPPLECQHGSAGALEERGLLQYHDPQAKENRRCIVIMTWTTMSAWMNMFRMK